MLVVRQTGIYDTCLLLKGEGMDIISYHTKLSKDRHNILVKEKSVSYDEEVNFDTPLKIVQMMNTLFDMENRAEEYLYQIAFDSKMKILGVFEVTHGLVNATLASPREMMIRNILCGATGFVIVHNHPSGEATASMDDITLTKRVSEAGKMMGILLNDSIIIGSNRYFSFHEQNMIDQYEKAGYSEVMNITEV